MAKLEILLILITANLALSFSIPLLARETIIGFKGIPDCTNTSCFPLHSSSIGCPQFTQTCFCDALQPLKCADTACLGNDWYAVEDWYASVCPHVPTVDFSRFALCGRECIRKAIIPGWCNATVVGTNTLTRNCFCRIGENGFMGASFKNCMTDGCQLNGAEASAYLSDFWEGTCLLTPGSENTNFTSYASDQVIQFPRLPQQAGSGGGMSKAETLNLVLGIISGFGFIICTLISWWRKILCFAYRRRPAKPHKLSSSGPNTGSGNNNNNNNGSSPPATTSYTYTHGLNTTSTRGKL
ncbi:hypothetical protein TWF694_006288 [Orbilia ellipsospora]|uniref:Extracellular membrane protein CFEM domain-containing protein n=1 Tax=Orbilia ellipsospora TaxID=2528407 RepID=A0AAV9XK13_9PEZI